MIAEGVTTRRREVTAVRRIRWAAVLQLVQGLLMEGAPFVGVLVLLPLGVDQSVVAQRFSFIVPFFTEHLYLMMVISGVFGALRVIASVGLLRDRMWGFSLSLINCTVTLALMIFMLPAGIIDGLLSGTALVLLLTAWHGDARLSSRIAQSDASAGPSASSSSGR